MEADNENRPNEQTTPTDGSSDGVKQPFVMWQFGKIKDMNREFDIAYWQAQDTSARMNAAWELVAHYLKSKGREDELRLQRSVESFHRKPR